MTYNPDGDKIDSKATDGLLGVHNSLAYRVHEIERHLHSGGRWFGAAAVPSGETHIADRVGPAIAPFTLTSGNDDWGTWVQIMGSDDTPTVAQAYFDPHLIQIESVTDDGTYFIQVGRGASGAAALSAGTYTELVATIATTKEDASPVVFQSGRAPAGSKLWARILCMGQNARAIDIYIGIHEYEG